MKKLFYLLFLLFFSCFISAQNVGIGTPTPNEKLDVNGNINVTGTIKANGADGTPNQVLMKNGSGSLVWGDMCEYKNLATFTAGGTSSWAVPAGVTKVWVELWGAGAGGCWYGGGGGGGYISGVFPVTPGNTVSYTVGVFGNGGTATGTIGGSSTVTYAPSSITLLADGGKTPSLSGSIVLGGGGGSYGVSIGFTSFIGFVGESGNALMPNTFQYNATTFIDYTTGGDGGNAANTTATGGKGGFFIFNSSTSTTIRTKFGVGGAVPGGGGGSGYAGIISLTGLGNSAGSPGANGMVIIHY